MESASRVHQELASGRIISLCCMFFRRLAWVCSHGGDGVLGKRTEALSILLKTGTLSLLQHSVGQSKLQGHLRFMGGGIESTYRREEFQGHTFKEDGDLEIFLQITYHTQVIW